MIIIIEFFVGMERKTDTKKPVYHYLNENKNIKGKLLGFIYPFYVGV